jgi:hypothetical protein
VRPVQAKGTGLRDRKRAVNARQNTRRRRAAPACGDGRRSQDVAYRPVAWVLFVAAEFHGSRAGDIRQPGPWRYGVQVIGAWAYGPVGLL